MKDKHKQFEKYVCGLFEKYSPILLMDKFTFALKKGLENDDCLMECAFNYPYLNVTIKYGDKVYQKWMNGENIEPYVIHEMCHPLTDGLYSKSIQRCVSKDEILDERERLTDHICNIVVKAKLC